MKPQTFSYLQQFGYNSCADLRTGDWSSISHCFWPINCTPTHWSCAVHGMEDNAPIVYMDTIGCLSTPKEKCPRDIVQQLSKVMECNAPNNHLQSSTHECCHAKREMTVAHVLISWLRCLRTTHALSRTCSNSNNQFFNSLRQMNFELIKPASCSTF